MTDGDAPWFYWTGFGMAYEEMVIDTIDVPVVTGYREVIDSKAMRIVRNQEIQFVVENVTSGIAATVTLELVARILAGHG